MRRNHANVLIWRGIFGKSFSYPTVSDHPLSYFCAIFQGVSSHEEEKEKPISRKPRFDFSCIRELDDAVCLFRFMVGVRPKPSVIEFNKLLTVVGKMKHFHAALLMFDAMRQLAVLDIRTMNIAINYYCQLNRVDFGMSILGSFFKLGHEPNTITFTTLIKGLFSADKAYDAVEIFVSQPDEVTFLAVINGLCKAGHSLMARDLLFMLEKRNLQT